MARNNSFRSTGKSAASFAARNTEKAVVGVARYAATNRIGRGFISLPGMNFVESVIFFIVQFIVGIIGCFVAGGIAYLMIVYGAPLFLDLIFQF